MPVVTPEQRARAILRVVSEAVAAVPLEAVSLGFSLCPSNL